MDIEQIKIRALQHYKAKRWDQIPSLAFSGIFSVTGLSWPYFLLGEYYRERNDTSMSSSMYKLFLLRITEKDQQEWRNIAEDHSE